MYIVHMHRFEERGFAQLHVFGLFKVKTVKSI